MLDKVELFITRGNNEVVTRWGLVSPLCSKRRMGEAKFSVVDMFSGCGGLSLGVYEACSSLGMEFNCIDAIDVDSTCLDVYSRNFVDSDVSCENAAGLFDGELESSPTVNERDVLEPPVWRHGRAGIKNYRRLRLQTTQKA